MQFFNYCLNQLSPRNLLLSDSISWQWLPFHLIKTQGKSKQVIKIGWHLNFTPEQNTKCSCRFQLKLLFTKTISHSYGSKSSLQFFPWVSTTISRNFKDLLHTYHLKDVKNIHNTFLALIPLFNSNNLSFSFF